MTWIAELDGSFTYSVEDYAVHFLRPRLTSGGVYSGVWADVSIGLKKKLIHEARYNLSSLSSRREMAKFLATRATLPEGYDWTGVIETACTRMCREMRKGKPIVNLADLPDPGEPCYSVEKMILANQINILFGAEEAGKSLLLCGLAYAIGLGDGLLGLIARPQPVWYLDWETDENEIKRRLLRLARGLGTETIPDINYIRMDRPLFQETETLSKITGGVVFFDSLTPACGGEINSPEAPTAFWNVARAIPATLVIVGQTQKADNGKGKTVLGSGLFGYMGRSRWEIIGCQDGDTVHVAAFHRKSNMGKRWSPLAWRFDFDDSARTTRVEAEPVEAVHDFAKRMTLADQIEAALHALGNKGAVKDIAAAAEAKEDVIRTTLNRHSGRFVKLDDGSWGLRSPHNSVTDGYA